MCNLRSRYEIVNPCIPSYQCSTISMPSSTLLQEYYLIEIKLMMFKVMGTLMVQNTGKHLNKQEH